VPTQEKVDTIEDLKTRLHGVKTVLLTEYRGLTVEQLSNLRKQLRSVSAEYKIVKNRLARLALSPELAGVRTHLKGPTGMILSREDAVAVAKTLHTFAKTNIALVIKAGYVEGQMLAPDGLKALADLPSKDALRSAIVGALQGPLVQLVGLLVAPQRDLVYVLEQRGKMEPPAAAAEAAPAAAASTDAAPADAAPAETAAPSA
jgi:large subunit ribosomal protein L10